MKHLYLLAALLAATFACSSQTVLLPEGSVWKFLDNGSDQATAWRLPAFNDAGWNSGSAQLGYGDGDEATIISFGTDAANKYITTYFRGRFTVNNPSAYSQLNFSLKRDDGAVVYLNGIEIYRSNLAAGTISYTTLASLASDDGATPVTFTLPAAQLATGENVIAVEIHQNAVNSSDISFDLGVTATLAPAADALLINYGDAWKYLDNGSNQGTAWRSTTFNDAGWKTGNAPLGYGNASVVTTVSFGSRSTKKYITTYFRKNISVTDPSLFSALQLSVKRDDGAVVYINGAEVFRTNMPAGSVSNTTRASANAADEGATPQVITFPSSALLAGNNVVAVEIHQSAPTSSDIFFDLQLKAVAAAQQATLVRGPYLQMVSETAATIRWRTDIATNSTIKLGTVHGTYPLVANDVNVSTEHEVRISGLNAETKYYYSFGSSTQTLQAATDNFFLTAAPASTTKKIRVAVFGDCGRNDNNYQAQTLAQYRNYVGNNPAELLLLLGDNAYTNGTDAEYQTQFFNAYQSTILKNHALFPAPGNHDYYSSSQDSRTGAYYQNFSMPANGECGGLASNTEAWYSYNWGNIHFISLDSYGKENSNTTRLYDTLGAQVSWLKNDLAANTKKWTVVYWHHPPYTMGSHNSDTESELVNIRQNFITILERYGVDLVMCGHSHDYERSYLLKGYTTNEAGFNLATHAVSASSGKYNSSSNSCTYTTALGKVNHGTMYVVSGSSGASGGVQAGYPHNALPFAINDGGMFYFEVDDNRMDAKFIRRTGEIWDQFTVMKGVNNSQDLTITAGESATLTASWPGTYSWSTGANTRSISVSPAATSTYTVSDAQGCVQDAFTVNVLPASTTNITRGKGKSKLVVYPVPSAANSTITIESGKAALLKIYNANGALIKQVNTNGVYRLNDLKLTPGVYMVHAIADGTTQSQRFIVQ